MTAPKPTAVEHGVAQAIYSLSGLGLAYRPMMICLCGYSTSNGGNDNWEEAGAEFDDHLSQYEEDDDDE